MLRCPVDSGDVVIGARCLGVGSEEEGQIIQLKRDGSRRGARGCAASAARQALGHSRRNLRDRAAIVGRLARSHASCVALFETYNAAAALADVLEVADAAATARSRTERRRPLFAPGFLPRGRAENRLRGNCRNRVYGGYITLLRRSRFRDNSAAASPHQEMWADCLMRTFAPTWTRS